MNTLAQNSATSVHVHLCIAVTSTVPHAVQLCDAKEPLMQVLLLLHDLQAALAQHA